MDDKYIAHVKKRDYGGWETHSVSEHLKGTAEIAKKFAEEFGNP